MKVFVVIGGDHSSFDIDSVYDDYKKAESRTIEINEKCESGWIYGILEYDVQ